MDSQSFLRVGDPAPYFTARCSSNPLYHFDTAAGHYLVLAFFGSAATPYARQLLAAVNGPLQPLFDDAKVSFFGVTVEAADEAKLPTQLPGRRYFYDTDRAVSRLYGILQQEESAWRYRPQTFVLDPQLRVIATLPMDVPDHAAQLETLLRALPPIDQHAGVPLNAPVLVIPRVFEPEFCRELIGLYHQHGGYASGFMRQVDGVTVGMLDDSFKKRRDFAFEQQEEYAPLRAQIRERLQRRLVPEIQRAFQYHVTRIERYIVACYDGEEGGFFRRHRDNTTTGTAHRRFACTLNLNAEEYDGGELCFPEFGSRTYRAPTGGAVVFSCSLLHEATPVTRGTRYAFLPFLYDEEGAKIRRQNSASIRDETGVGPTA